MEGHIVLLAAEGGTTNFLIPNGTFFVILAIFLVLLAVIAKFVVPPIQEVLGEREKMVAKTAEDNRRAAEQEAAAEADYNAAIHDARAEAAAIRDQARSEGRAVIDRLRAEAGEEVATELNRANEELKVQSDALSGDLRASVESLSATLASRVLGVPVNGSSGTSATVSSTTVSGG